MGREGRREAYEIILSACVRAYVSTFISAFEALQQCLPKTFFFFWRRDLLIRRGHAVGALG